MNREAIYAAAFAQLGAIPGFRTVSRRLKHWTDVPRVDCPAAYFVQRNEVCSVTRGQPRQWMLNVDVILYAYAESTDDASPMVILNPLMDAVCARFNPDPVTGTVTLGGLAYHSQVSGSIETDEGTLGELAVAVIPITIVQPD